MPRMTRRSFSCGAALSPLLALLPGQVLAQATPEQLRAIAKEAYIYAYPMVDGYRIIHAYFVNPASPEYKASWNQLVNIPRVYTPEDKAVQTPNSDTPYSMLGLDLRAEPMVLTLPAIDKERYFSVQLVDLYTFNFDYLGSRTTGNGGGSYLIAGPRWTGEVPAGISKVIRAESELALAIYRTQLFSPDDLENVKQVQAGYRAEPLSAFLGTPAPAPAPAIDFIAPLTHDVQRSSVEIFGVLNFLLQFCPTDPSEQALMERFAAIGVGPGQGFDAAALPAQSRAAMEQGIADAWVDFAALKKRADAREVTSGDLFGTRADLRNNYLYRMMGAVLGIFGNSKLEAIYPFYVTDAEQQPFDGANRYSLRFEPGQLPPVNGFWSLTMYELPASLLYANALNRYLLNSPMLPRFKPDADGGLTFHIQTDSPGADREANWLPAPKGPFFMAMRLYWPKPEALDGKWVAPPAKRLA